MKRIARKKTCTPEQRQQWAAARKEEVARLCARLEASMESLRNSDNYRRYLTAMGKFHNYSYRNTALIIDQFPTASLVCSLKSWNALGRTVKKGEHGIRILAPILRSARRNIPAVDEATGMEKRAADGTVIFEDREVVMTGCKPVSVFDISQTAGEPLPQVACELQGDMEGYDRLFGAIVRAADVRVATGPTDNDACGMADTAMRVVTLREGMSQRQNIKTLLHEAAHVRLHPPGNTLTRELREVQAESIAFVVSAHFGLDTSDYSVGYVEGWGSGPDNPEFQASLDTISRHASTLIGEVEKELARDLEKTPQAHKAAGRPAPKRSAAGMDR